MNLYLATFVVRGSDSDTEAINSAVSVLDFIPVIRAVNMHVFLIRSEKTHAQLESLLTECCDPDDFVHLAEHPRPADICESLEEAQEWLAQAARREA